MRGPILVHRPIWVHMSDDIGSCERAVMGLESRTVSTWIS